MNTEFSELNDKLEKLEGSFLEKLDSISPLEFSEIPNEVSEADGRQIEYSASCGCYVACGGEYSRNGKCGCYTSCGSNYNKG